MFRYIFTSGAFLKIAAHIDSIPRDYIRPFFGPFAHAEGATDRDPSPCRSLLAVALLLPVLAHAQSQFTGQVRDESGAVLPGVLVEA